MMEFYKNKKVGNKYAIVFVSFLLFISSLLAFNPSWLNKFYGETLCASSTAPTLDSSYFNYKDSSFASKFDYAFNNLESFSTSSSSCYFDYSVVPLNNSDFSYFTTGMLSATTRNLVYYGPRNLDLTNSYGSFSSYNYYSLSTYQLKSLRFTYRSSYSTHNILLDLSNTGIMAWISNLDFVLSYSYNNNYYTVCSMSLYNKYLAYQDGLADADTTSAYNNGYNAGQSDGYNSGYTAGNSAGVTTGQNNVINNPNDYDLYTQSQYDSNYTNGYNTGYNDGIIQGQNNVINNPSQFGLYTQSQYESNYTNGYNDGINNVVSNPSQYNLYTQSQYDQNYQDGVESTTNYQDGLANGIIQGQNNVINNPHNYGLFTQSDLDSEYQRGYTDGVNETFNLYDGYGVFLYSDFYWTKFDDKYTHLTYDGVDSSNYILSGKFSNHTNLFDKLPGGFSISDDYVYMITDLDGNEYLNMDYSILWFEFYNGISVDNFPTIVVPGSQRLGSDYFVEFFDGTILSYSGADVVFDGINLSSYTGNYIKRVGIGTINIQDYFNSSDGFAFNTRDSYTYQLGYSDGYSVGDSNGYTKGYDSGYGVGRSDGINSAEGNTFTSLIMAVVDAPINMFKSLFNFDILGFNLLGFATGVFTLCVFIFIIKKFMGK